MGTTKSKEIVPEVKEPLPVIPPPPPEPDPASGNKYEIDIRAGVLRRGQLLTPDQKVTIRIHSVPVLDFDYVADKDGKIAFPDIVLPMYQSVSGYSDSPLNPDNFVVGCVDQSKLGITYIRVGNRIWRYLAGIYDLKGCIGNSIKLTFVYEPGYESYLPPPRTDYFTYKIDGDSKIDLEQISLRVIVLASNRIRKEVCSFLSKGGKTVYGIRIGENGKREFSPQVILGPGKTRIEKVIHMGDYNLINPDYYFGDDVQVGNYNDFGFDVYIGDHVKIGDECTIGARAVIRSGSVVPDKTVIKEGEVYGS